MHSDQMREYCICESTIQALIMTLLPIHVCLDIRLVSWIRGAKLSHLVTICIKYVVHHAVCLSYAIPIIPFLISFIDVFKYMYIVQAGHTSDHSSKMLYKLY